MFELRILSGMHRGATLPLDQRALNIGADDDADVVLVDPGIAAAHATLEPGAQGWTLSALDGDVRGSEDNRLHDSLDLAPGQFARLGHVWLCVAGTDAPWQSPPPEPAPSAADEPLDESFDESGPAMDSMDGLDDHEPYSDSPLDDPEPAPAPPPPPPPPPARPAAKPVRRAGWRRSKMVIMPLTLAAILSACAYSISSHKTEDKPAAKVPLAPAPAPAPAAAPKISQAELRELFQGRLKEVDLLKRFKLDLKDKDWTMQAFLDDEEAARFDRILKAFVQTHNIKFPVHARVGSAEAMLPFRIREVVTGSNASLVTQDGKRLYVGDELRGLRLVSIDGHQLQFDGERRIKVTW